MDTIDLLIVHVVILTVVVIALALRPRVKYQGDYIVNKVKRMDSLDLKYQLEHYPDPELIKIIVQRINEVQLVKRPGGPQS